VTNTRRESSADLVRRLSHDGVKLNVTALLTLEQVRDITAALAGGAPSCVSVFAGRIADTGYDPVPLMAAAVEMLRVAPGAELIWASPRELLNIFQADAIGCHIITVTHDILKKLPTLGKDPTPIRSRPSACYDDAQKAVHARRSAWSSSRSTPGSSRMPRGGRGPDAEARPCDRGGQPQHGCRPPLVIRASATLGSVETPAQPVNGASRANNLGVAALAGCGRVALSILMPSSPRLAASKPPQAAIRRRVVGLASCETARLGARRRRRRLPREQARWRLRPRPPASAGAGRADGRPVFGAARRPRLRARRLARTGGLDER
jgi:hypothetical protein